MWDGMGLLLLLVLRMYDFEEFLEKLLLVIRRRIIYDLRENEWGKMLIGEGISNLGKGEESDLVVVFWVWGCWFWGGVA